MQIKPDSNIDAALKHIQQLEQAAHNLGPVFDEVANLLLNATEDAFLAETSPDGQAWLPLSDATLKTKKGRGKAQYDSGKMQDSLNVYSDNRGAVIGFNATSPKGYAYPAVQHFGTDDGRVPARRALPFDDDGDTTDEVKDGIIELVAEFFEAV